MKTFALLSCLLLCSGCAAKLVKPALPGDKHPLVLVCFDGPEFPKTVNRIEGILPVHAPTPTIGRSLQQRFLADYAERKDAFREEARAAGLSVPADLQPADLRPLGWTLGAAHLNPDRRMPGDLVAKLRSATPASAVLLGEAYFLCGDWQGTTSTPQRVAVGLAFQWAAYSLENGEPLARGFSIKQDVYVSEVRLPERPSDLATSLDEQVEGLRGALFDQLLTDLLERHIYRVDAR